MRCAEEMNKNNETYINISLNKWWVSFLTGGLQWILKCDKWTIGGADGGSLLVVNLIGGEKYIKRYAENPNIFKAPECFALNCNEH